MTERTLLSKWWQTDSAKLSFERVEKARKERIAKVREAFEKRKKELAEEVNTWEVK